MKILKIIALILLMYQANALAQSQVSEYTFNPLEVHSKHWIFGIPQGSFPTNDLIIRDIYALSSNDTTKFADWVAYRLTPYEVVGTLDLARRWRADPWLINDETLEPDDYKQASKEGYDRGHQAPLAAFKGSRYASQVNYLSNITPQKNKLNQGPWKILEEKVRNLARRGFIVWVITGPLYEREMKELPNADEPHYVPSGYWKIITLLQSKQLLTVAFIMDQNTLRKSPLKDHIKTVRQVEDLTGLNFFWQLPNNVEDLVETQVSQSLVNALLK